MTFLFDSHQFKKFGAKLALLVSLSLCFCLRFIVNDNVARVTPQCTMFTVHTKHCTSNNLKSQLLHSPDPVFIHWDINAKLMIYHRVSCLDRSKMSLNRYQIKRNQTQPNHLSSMLNLYYLLVNVRHSFVFAVCSSLHFNVTHTHTHNRTLSTYIGVSCHCGLWFEKRHHHNSTECHFSHFVCSPLFSPVF